MPVGLNKKSAIVFQLELKIYQKHRAHENTIFYGVLLGELTGFQSCSCKHSSEWLTNLLSLYHRRCHNIISLQSTQYFISNKIEVPVFRHRRITCIVLMKNNTNDTWHLLVLHMEILSGRRKLLS